MYKIGKIKKIPFQYIRKKDIKVKPEEIDGYFTTKERNDKSSRYVTINSLTDDRQLFLELSEKKKLLHRVKGYVPYEDGSGYTVYTKLTIYPIIILLLLIPMLLLNFTPIEMPDIHIQEMSSEKEKENNQNDNKFDIKVVSAGTITKDNCYIPFTNPSNNKLLCKYLFYNEDGKLLDETDYIEPADDKYYYFDAYQHFSAGEHILYFTVQTLHSDTGQPDTSANLSMPITVEKE